MLTRNIETSFFKTIYLVDLDTIAGLASILIWWFSTTKNWLYNNLRVHGPKGWKVNEFDKKRYLTWYV